MFDTELMEYEVDLLHANHLYESALDTFNIEAFRLTALYNGGYVTESEDISDALYEANGNLASGLKMFFMKIRDAITKLIRNTQIKITTSIAERDISKSLKLLRNAISTGKVPNDITIPKVNVSSYFKALTSFLSSWTKNLEKFYKHGKKLNDDITFTKFKEKLDRKIEASRESFGVDNLNRFTSDYKITDLVILMEKELGGLRTIMTSLEKLSNTFNTELWKMVDVQTSGPVSDNTIYSALQSDLNKFAALISRAIHVIGGCMLANCKSVIDWYNSPSYDNYQRRKLVEQSMRTNEVLNNIAMDESLYRLQMMNDQHILNRDQHVANHINNVRSAVDTTSAMADMYNQYGHNTNNYSSF